MIRCSECGHENTDCALDCANCAKGLQRPTRKASDEKAAAELEVMLDELDLPEAAGAPSAGEAVDGAELFHLFVQPGATAGEVSAMDVEALAQSVAYRRSNKVTPGAVEPVLTDEQMAEGILDYVRTAPPDTRAGKERRAASGQAVPEVPGRISSSQRSPAIQIAQVIVLVVLLVSMFAPWGRDGGVISDGWVFALWFTLISCGGLGVLYAGLLLYGMTVAQAVYGNWVRWVPRGIQPFTPKGIVEAIDRPWTFWASRLALVLWLFLGPTFILSTNIRDWPLDITWGAKLFLVAISLANAIEALSLIYSGRKASRRPWMVTGVAWVCLSLLVLPVAATLTHTQITELDAQTLLAEYQSGERSFDHAVVPYLCLAEASLPGIELIDADLRGADVRGGNLHGANLQKAHLFGANLSGADLGGANLSGAHVMNSDLAGADLSAAHLEGAFLSHADLTGADLSGADLREAELYWADLSKANLRGADLTGAILWKASLRSAQMDDNTRIAPKWRLVWEIASNGAVGRDLAGVDLSRAYLGDTDLSEADLTGTNLESACLSDANLSGADLEGADLSGAMLDGTDFSEANLAGATVEADRLAEARSLKGATMPDGTVHE